LELLIRLTLPALTALEKNTQGIKPGELQLPLRIMLVGEKMGPPVFEIASLLGKEETKKRINNLIDQTGNW
jgi:glutamyl-tRNA synthetase